MGEKNRLNSYIVTGLAFTDLSEIVLFESWLDNENKLNFFFNPNSLKTFYFGVTDSDKKKYIITKY